MGYAMLLIPGLLLGISYSLIGFVVCLERGKKNILRRCRELSLGFRWVIVKTGIVMLLSALVVTISLSIPVYFIAHVLNTVKIGQIMIDYICDVFQQIVLIAMYVIYVGIIRVRKTPGMKKEYWFLKWAP